MISTEYCVFVLFCFLVFSPGTGTFSWFQAQSDGLGIGRPPIRRRLVSAEKLLGDPRTSCFGGTKLSTPGQ